jgi:hypothetical protein
MEATGMAENEGGEGGVCDEREHRSEIRRRESASEGRKGYRLLCFGLRRMLENHERRTFFPSKMEERLNASEITYANTTGETDKQTRFIGFPVY